MDAKQWLNIFDQAIVYNNFRDLASIVPQSTDLKELKRRISNANNAKRRDVMFNHQMGYHFGVEDMGEWTVPAYNRRYEDNFVEAISAVLPNNVIKLTRPINAKVGTEVRIWIKDHYYDDQRGVVKELRGNGQMLVEITTKAARGGVKTNPVMWVKPTELRAV